MGERTMEELGGDDHVLAGLNICADAHDHARITVEQLL
jgi:hypothetical protein